MQMQFVLYYIVKQANKTKFAGAEGLNRHRVELSADRRSQANTIIGERSQNMSATVKTVTNAKGLAQSD